MTVRIDGQEVPATAVPFDDNAVKVRRAAMLAIDTSGSMRTDGGLAGAKSAAAAYLQSVPADVEVGLVAFADKPRVVSPPTTDRAAVLAAVDKLVAVGRTALYDGVVLATSALGTTGSRSIVLLSDGKDTDSTATLASAAAGLKSTHVSLSAVSLGNAAAQQTQSAALVTLAAAGGGKMVPVSDPAQLTQVFQSAAQSLASQVVVEVTVPPSAAGTSKPLSVSATAGQQTVGDEVVALFPAADAPPPNAADHGPKPIVASESTLVTQPWFLPVAVGAVGLGLAVLLGVAFVSSDREGAKHGPGRAAAEPLLADRTQGGEGGTHRWRPGQQRGRPLRCRSRREGRPAEGPGALSGRGWRRPGSRCGRRSGCCCTSGPRSCSVSCCCCSRTSRSPPACSGLVIGVLVPLGYLSAKESSPQVGVREPAARHAAAAGRQPVRRLLAAAGDRRRRPGGLTSRWPRSSTARSSRPASACRSRTRSTRRRRPDGQHRLRLGRHGDPHPARGRRQPRRGAHHRRRHAARARAAAPPGPGALGRGPALGAGSSRPAVLFIVYLPLVAARVHLSRSCTDPLGWLMIGVGVVSARRSASFWLRKVVKVEV